MYAGGEQREIERGGRERRERVWREERREGRREREGERALG